MIATSIEQSKELLRLGLPAESSDMHYVRKVTDFMGNKIENPKWSVPKYGNPNSKHANYIVQNFTDFEILAAWSIDTLFDIIRNELDSYTISNETDGYILFVDYATTDKQWRVWIAKCKFGHIVKIKHICTNENKLTATFEMIKWLLEQRLIKNELD